MMYVMTKALSHVPRDDTVGVSGSPWICHWGCPVKLSPFWEGDHIMIALLKVYCSEQVFHRMFTV